MNSNIVIGRFNSSHRRMNRVLKSRLIDLLLSISFGIIIFLTYKKYMKPGGDDIKIFKNEKITAGRDYSYNQNMPLIFIGGVPRSGTTLMRSMLDAHPEVRCGQETRVIPRMLQYYSRWLNSEKESMRLNEAGINKNVLTNAVAQFCLEIIAHHGEPAERLCNKDPLTLKFGVLIKDLFPNMKFIFMVRDGRAVVHSIISRKVTVTGFDLNNYRESIKKWNRMIKAMYVQCELLGNQKCLIVNYEKLVLKPKETMEGILNFLDLPWNENVLHHQDFINKSHGIALSKVERSSDQVVKAINLEALEKWVGQFPQKDIKDMAKIAPMLRIMGYDPHQNPPHYENANFKIDEEFLENYPGRNQRHKVADEDIE